MRWLALSLVLAGCAGPPPTDLTAASVVFVCFANCPLALNLAGSGAEITDALPIEQQHLQVEGIRAARE